MSDVGLPLETADALALAGVDRRMWQNMMQRQFYPGAPPVEAGHPRYFDRDDMVALFVFDHFHRTGLGQAMAGRVASAVRTELRKGGEQVRKLWVVATVSGTPRRVVATEPPDDLIRHEVDVAKLRRKIVELVAERFG